MCEQQIINISLGSKQNSFYPMFNNSDIMITWHLRRVVPTPEILLFTRKKHQWNRQIWGMSSKMPSRMFVHQPLLYLLTLVYYSINSFLVEPRKYRRGLWQPWASRLGRYPNGILLWSVVLLKYGLLDFCCIYHLKLLFNFRVYIPNTKDLLEVTSDLFLPYILVPREVLVLTGFAVTLAGTGIWG